MTILYFTSTGNSLYVAKELGDEVISIPSLVKRDQYEWSDDKIGIVFPIYSNKVLPYIEQFLKQAKFNCDYLFAVVTYGIFAAASPDHLQEIAQKSGYQFDYINKVKMVDNWLPGFKMESQIKNEHKKDISGQLAAIRKDIESSKKNTPKSSFFNRLVTNYQIKAATKPHEKGNVTGAVIGLGIKNYITVEDTCIACSVCAKVCPMDNITVDKEAKTIHLGGSCISCFSCTHNCPTNSIRLKGERSKARFRNSHITLAEIMKANNE